jgi:hypothetical protein
MEAPLSAARAGIADWELPYHAPPPAQRLLELLAPHLATVAAAVRPLLAARGLSLAEATVENLLASDGLAETVLSAAVEAGSSGLFPSGSISARERPGRLPTGWIELEMEPSGLALAAPPEARRLVTSPLGWEVHREGGPRHLAYDEHGEPCYPDTPQFDEFWPKCPQPETEAPASDAPCTEDARFLRAEQRLQSLRNFERLPSSFRGFDYQVELKRSVSRPPDELYRCGEHPSSPNTLASWVGPPGPGVVRLYERFLDLELEWDVLSVITGPIDFRAAVLLHEHVHRIEDPETGTVSAPADRDYEPLGSAGQQDCPFSGTEYDAAYLQALYLGSSEALARVVADIYGRAQCARLSRAARLLAAAGDLIDALALGWLASLEVIVTLAGRLGGEPQAMLDLLAELLPADIAALVGIVL